MFSFDGSVNDPEVADQLILVPRPEIIAAKFVSSPAQRDRSPIGSILGASLMTMVIVVPLAHSSAFGVKVYVVVLILSGAGDHAPSIPFKLVFGKLMDSPSHT